MNEERLGAYFLAERSHLTFAEYLPRAATGAPARPFARHTRGLSRPRGHRFCLKGQKSPTHSKRSPARHQGERDGGGGGAGRGVNYVGTAGAWAVGAEHTARDAEDALRNRDGQNGRAGAAPAGARERGRCQDAPEV